ncbi:MAG: CPBP family intramembrane metalloprotease [Sedimentisphaerales bacterium]|nr:CPBP family intramembrane metalloprotease [Sedimentisphaerales bacterium]
MARKIKSTSNQLLNFARDSYLERTSRPVYAVVYLLPFIIFYELGTIFINTDVLSQTQVRVVAFVWLQDFLRYLGFGGKFLWMAPALVVVVILLAYQYVSGKSWFICFTDMLPMTIECVLLAIPLIVLSLFLHSSSVTQNFFVSNTAAQPAPTLLADIVTGVGAGIYEELLFRLVLICSLLMLFQDVLGFGKNNSIALAVLVSAALFGAHHHIDFLSGRHNQADLFDWAKFIFRIMAGVYFALLFAIRGFGITAGTHAFYDIIATLLNALLFMR